MQEYVGDIQHELKYKDVDMPSEYIKQKYNNMVDVQKITMKLFELKDGN